MEWSVEQLDEKCSETMKPERGCVDSLEVGSIEPRQMVKGPEQWSPKRTPLLTSNFGGYLCSRYPPTTYYLSQTPIETTPVSTCMSQSTPTILSRFLDPLYPPPQKMSSARVLTSSECLQMLEEKRKQKEAEATLKEQKKKEREEKKKQKIEEQNRKKEERECEKREKQAKKPANRGRQARVTAAISQPSTSTQSDEAQRIQFSINRLILVSTLSLTLHLWGSQTQS